MADTMEDFRRDDVRDHLKDLRRQTEEILTALSDVPEGMTMEQETELLKLLEGGLPPDGPT